MNGLLFAILYLLIIIATLQNVLVFALFFVTLFTLRFDPIYLFPLAVLIDGYFGAFASTPIFSLFIIGWYVLSLVIRPALRLV